MKRSPILIAIGTMLLMTACSDDYFNKDVEGEYSDYIGYSVKVNGSDEFQSRSAVKSPTTSRLLSIEATEASIGGRQLFLHTEIIDSIPQAISRAKCDDSATASRGTVSTTASVADDGLSISAVVFDGDATDWPGNAEAQMYMHNDIVIAPWKTNRYWPRENNWIRFYAFSPIDALGNDGLGAISATEPSFSYTVADKIPDQQDLLVGSEQYAGNKCETAQIDLGHALTAVKILIDGNVTGFVLTKLYISGLKNSGTYTYQYNSGAPSDGNNASQTHDAGAWTSLTGNKEYIVYSDPNGKVLTTVNPDAEGNATGNTDMTANEDNMVMFLMPQTLTTDAKITIEGYDEVVGTDVKLEATIGDGVKKWNKGEMVTYTLSFTSTKIEYRLEVTPEDAANDGEYYLSPYHGETDVKFHVRSYKVTTTPGGTTEEAVDWEIDNTDMPFWIDQITASGTDAGTIQKNDAGVITNLNGTYSILPNLTSSDTHNTLLDKGLKGSKEKPWDLSTNAEIQGIGTPQNTANCYMVLSPGYYTLPLVYGNAITNGVDNPKSYHGDLYGNGTPHMGDVNSSYERRYDMTDVAVKDYDNLYVPEIDIKTRTYFPDAGGYAIKQPWIVNTNGRGGKYTPIKAEIVWQDEPCLVTEVALSENKDYITFRVREELITEGNAIIGIKDSDDDILWSWHIWVTDQIDECSGKGNVNFAEPKAMTNRLVTDGYKESATDPDEWTSYVENTFYLMHSHIGACDAATKEYEKATKAINFKLIDNGEEVVEGDGVTITRKGALNVGVNGTTLTMPDNATYYQFGRKDPMRPGWQEGSTSIDKPCYLHNRTLSETQANYKPETEAEGSYGLGIRRPDLFLRGSRDTDNNPTTNASYDGSTTLLLESWVTDYHAQYINLWNGAFNKLPVFSMVDINGDAAKFYKAIEAAILQGVTKTIYDPCPPGYEMPRFDTFTGVSFNSMNVHPFASLNSEGNYVLSDNINVSAVWPNINSLASSSFEGLSFYSLPMPSKGVRIGDEFYIHALGHRNLSGTIAQYNIYGAAATANPLCVQWKDSSTTDKFYKFQASRLCFIATQISIRSTSTSSFDLAFSVIPARTGQNPLTTVIDGNASWSGDGNKDGGYNVEF